MTVKPFEACYIFLFKKRGGREGERERKGRNGRGKEKRKKKRETWLLRKARFRAALWGVGVELSLSLPPSLERLPSRPFPSFLDRILLCSPG